MNVILVNLLTRLGVLCVFAGVSDWAIHGVLLMFTSFCVRGERDEGEQGLIHPTLVSKSVSWKCRSCCQAPLPALYGFFTCFEGQA